MLRETMRRDTPETNNFDFLRLLLAVLVIFSHSYPLLYGSRLWEPLCRATRGQIEAGAVAVDGFFVISGYLIAQSWVKGRGPADFARKRFLRIYPGFTVALLFCILVVAPLSGVYSATYFRDPATWQYLWSPLLLWQVHMNLPGVLLHNPFSGAVNGSLWTIPYELQCYAMVAVLGLLGLYRRRLGVLILLVAVFAFYNAEPYLHLRHFHALLDRDYLPRLVTYYLAGMTAYFYRDRLPHSRWLVIASAFALMLTLHRGLSLTLPVFGTYLLLHTAFSRTLRLQNFARHGDISYGIYLYAFPVQQLLIMRWPHSLTPTTLFLLALPCTVLLAIISWHWVEQPFLKLARRTRQLSNTAVLPLEEVGPQPTYSA